MKFTLTNLLKPTDYKRQDFLFVCWLLIILLILELLISNLSFDVDIAGLWSVVIFVVISIIFILGQNFLLGSVRRLTADTLRRSKIIFFMNRFFIIFQCVIASILIWVLLQIALTDQYYTAALTLGISISYSLSVAIIGILAFRFLIWYKSNYSFVVLLYGLSSAAIAIRLFITVIFYVSLLLNAPPERNIDSEVYLQEFEPTTYLGSLNDAFTISHSISLILLWITTSILLRSYYQRKWKIKYWLIVAIIPAYALSDFFISDVVVAESVGLSPVNYDIFITFQGVAAGVLVSIPFWVMSRSVQKRSRSIQDYLNVSAIGIFILFMAGSALIDHAPYPPFGLVLLLSNGLASYLLLTGLYSSAILTSSDTDLRLYIRRLAESESKLLYSIGFAEFEQDIERRVDEQSKKIEEETGIKTSIEEDEVKEYLRQVVEELERSGSRTRKRNDEHDESKQ